MNGRRRYKQWRIYVDTKWVVALPKRKTCGQAYLLPSPKMQLECSLLKHPVCELKIILKYDLFIEHYTFSMSVLLIC